MPPMFRPTSLLRLCPRLTWRNLCHRLSFCDISMVFVSCALFQPQGRYCDESPGDIARKGRRNVSFLAHCGTKCRCLHPPPVCIKVKSTVAHRYATIFFCDWVFSFF